MSVSAGLRGGGCSGGFLIGRFLTKSEELSASRSSLAGRGCGCQGLEGEVSWPGLDGCCRWQWWSPKDLAARSRGSRTSDGVQLAGERSRQTQGVACRRQTAAGSSAVSGPEAPQAPLGWSLRKEPSSARRLPETSAISPHRRSRFQNGRVGVRKAGEGQSDGRVVTKPDAAGQARAQAVFPRRRHASPKEHDRGASPQEESAPGGPQAPQTQASAVRQPGQLQESASLLPNASTSRPGEDSRYASPLRHGGSL